MLSKEMFVIALREGAGGMPSQEGYIAEVIKRANLTARGFPGSADEFQKPELNQKPVVEPTDSTARKTSRL